MQTYIYVKDVPFLFVLWLSTCDALLSAMWTWTLYPFVIMSLPLHRSKSFFFFFFNIFFSIDKFAHLEESVEITEMLFILLYSVENFHYGFRSICIISFIRSFSKIILWLIKLLWPLQPLNRLAIIFQSRKKEKIVVLFEQKKKKVQIHLCALNALIETILRGMRCLFANAKHIKTN